MGTSCWMIRGRAKPEGMASCAVVYTSSVLVKSSYEVPEGNLLITVVCHDVCMYDCVFCV